MISVLTAVHDPERDHVEACLASVAAQTVADWQHVIVDDGSTEPYVHEILDRAERDPRVIVIRRPESGGIVAASSDALAAATGEYIALLDHDDVLEPDALALMSAALDDGADLAYSDHDILTPEGHLTRPYYKPDFSPEQLRNQNYMLHFVMARRNVIDAAGGFRVGFDGAQDHDLLLRVVERTDRVAHVAHVLYHWRQARTSVAADPAAKPWAYDAGVRAVQDHCDRTGIDATVEPGSVAGAYRIRRRLATAPRVSVVIPTRGSSRPVWGVERCFVAEAVDSLVDASTYPDLEFVVVYDRETPLSVLRYLEVIAGDRLVLVAYDRPFNFSDKMNVGADASSGELLLLLNDDTELITPDSIETMAAHLLDDSVGMVGPKLLFADGTVQDAGHVYNEHVLPGLVGWHGSSPGPGQLRPLAVEREVAGVTAAAAMVRRSLYDEVGGFDPMLWMNFNDVDLSLKIRATGRRIVWTPHASWHHFESQTRPPSAEPEEFVEIDRRWHDEINRDPYYNPNLVRRRTDWLERPWHSGHPPLDDIDTTVSHRTWFLERVSGTRWLSTLRSIRGRTALVAIALAIVTLVMAAYDDLPTTFWRGLTFGVLPAMLWLGVATIALFRGRRVLTASMLVAVTPSVAGWLAAGRSQSGTWIVAVLVGVGFAPLWRRHPARAGAAVAVGAVAALLLVRTNGAARIDDPGWVWFARDAVAQGADEGLAGLAAVLWWLAFAGIVAFVWIVGDRARALLLAFAPLVVGALINAVPAWQTRDGRVIGLCIVVAMTIAIAARVDQGLPGSRRLFDAVSVAVVAGWVAASAAMVTG